MSWRPKGAGQTIGAPRSASTTFARDEPWPGAMTDTSHNRPFRSTDTFCSLIEFPTIRSKAEISPEETGDTGSSSVANAIETSALVSAEAGPSASVNVRRSTRLQVKNEKTQPSNYQVANATNRGASRNRNGGKPAQDKKKKSHCPKCVAVAASGTEPIRLQFSWQVQTRVTIEFCGQRYVQPL